MAHPVNYLRTFSPSSLKASLISRVTKQAFLPSSRYGMCFRFYREKASALSSLVDSHRIAPTQRNIQDKLRNSYPHDGVAVRLVYSFRAGIVRWKKHSPLCGHETSSKSLERTINNRKGNNNNNKITKIKPDEGCRAQHRKATENSTRAAYDTRGTTINTSNRNTSHSSNYVKYANVRSYVYVPVSNT